MYNCVEFKKRFCIISLGRNVSYLGDYSFCCKYKYTQCFLIGLPYFPLLATYRYEYNQPSFVNITRFHWGLRVLCLLLIDRHRYYSHVSYIMIAQLSFQSSMRTFYSPIISDIIFIIALLIKMTVYRGVTYLGQYAFFGKSHIALDKDV